MKHLSILLLTAAIFNLAGAFPSIPPGLDAFARQDYATALKIWRPLAEKGDADAQHGLGMLYHSGLGVPQHPGEAVRWFKLAAAKGKSASQYALGTSYENGDGVPKDDVTALRWIKLAAAQDYESAQLNLGMRYEKGQGVTQDYVRAHLWYNLAAKSDSRGIEKRELVAKKMTPSQLAKAQNMAVECIASSFKKCE